MALIGFLGFGYIVSFNAALNLLAKDIFDVFASYGFTVIPLFVLMGQIAFNAGIAKRLFNASYKFIGHIPGGLAMATVAGATAFKAICGSSAATAATFASVAVPEMDRYGYSKKLSTGIVATVGTLGILIPAQRDPHRLRYHHRTVHRQVVSGRHCARTDHCLLFYRDYLRLVQNRSDSRAQGEGSDVEGAVGLTSGSGVGHHHLSSDHRRTHEGVFHPDRGGQRRDLRRSCFGSWRKETSTSKGSSNRFRNR